MRVRHSIEWRSYCLGSITNLKIRIAGRDRPAGLRGVGDRTERGAARAGTPLPSIQRMGDPLFRFDIHKQPPVHRDAIRFEGIIGLKAAFWLVPSLKNAMTENIVY